MKFEQMKVLRDVGLLTPDKYMDQRGMFIETHRAAQLAENIGSQVEFVQGNLSMSVPWVMRGLHYQLENPQGKLVRCIKGTIYDVAVDMRRSSPTFGKWVGQVLDDQQHQALWVPPGYAHGFLAFSQGATVQYECTTYYHEKSNRSLCWNDPDVGITWPLKMGMQPIVSEKDRSATPFKNAEYFA